MYAAALNRLRRAHPRLAADNEADRACLLPAGCCLACGCDRRHARAHRRWRERGEAHRAGTPSSS
eukprot:2817420-Pleurochrysis_carterae.AAC.1